MTLLDLFPTILDYAGVGCRVPIEGDSLRPLANGGDIDRPNAALIETYGSYGLLDTDLRAKSVITPEANLTMFGDGAGMLFDLQADPDERVNRYDDPDYATLRSELKDRLIDLLDRQNDPLPNRGRHPVAQH